MQACPDAFYKVSKPAYPELSPLKISTRKKLIDRLSHTALRKRLSRLGLHGAELQRVQQEFWSPKLSFESDGYGLTFMHWNVKDLTQHFGRRISHAILNHVRTIIVFWDEFGYYAAPGLVAMMQAARSLKFHVKFNAEQVFVTQRKEDFQSTEDFPVLSLG